MNYYIYLITPFIAWFICGVIKFAVNCIKERRFAFDLIGYGGMPSNHSAIVSSMASLIAFKEGIDVPAFGIALTLAFIVILDANSLRELIGKQSYAINHLDNYQGGKLRERVGHKKNEIFFGISTGVIVAYFLHGM